MEMPEYEAPRRRRRPRRRRKSGLPLVCAAAAQAALGVLLSQVLDHRLPGDGVAVPEYVVQDLLPVNEWSRPGTALEKIDAVVIHYVGNPGTTAQANRNYFASLSSGEEGTYASSHFIVGLEGEVLQCIPLMEISYASNTRNSDTVAIEVCHPDETGKFSPVTYDRLVELTAWLCREFRLDPERDVIRHYDVTGKICPKYFVEEPAAWDQFRMDVDQAMAALEESDR